MNSDDIPDELKGVSAQYLKDMESINGEEQAHKEQFEKDIEFLKEGKKDDAFKGAGLDRSDPVEKKKGKRKKDDDDKPETSGVHIRLNEKMLGMVKTFDYRTKEELNSEDEFSSPHILTAMKLGYIGQLPNDADLRPFLDLFYDYPDAKLWITSSAFKKIDLCGGKRTEHYYSRILTEDAGMLGELRDKYLFDGYSDTLLVMGTLLAFKERSVFNKSKGRYLREIEQVEELIEELKIFPDKSFDEILNAILLNKVSFYDMPIFTSFIYNFLITGDKVNKKRLKLHKDKLINIINYLNEFKAHITEEEAKREVAAIVNLLLK